MSLPLCIKIEVKLWDVSSKLFGFGLPDKLTMRTVDHVYPPSVVLPKNCVCGGVDELGPPTANPTLPKNSVRRISNEASRTPIDSSCTSLIGPLISIAYRFVPSAVVDTVDLLIAMDVFKLVVRFPEMTVRAGYFVLDASVSASVPMIRLFKKYPPPTERPLPCSVASRTNTFDELSPVTKYAPVPVRNSC